MLPHAAFVKVVYIKLSSKIRIKLIEENTMTTSLASCTSSAGYDQNNQFYLDLEEIHTTFA